MSSRRLELEKSRLTFKPIERDDLPLLQSWRNSPDVRLICREYRLLTMEHQADWYERIVLNKDYVMFKIVIDRVPVGVCGWTFIDWRSRHALLSMYIAAPEYQTDDGYLVVLTELNRIAFDELGLETVRAEVYDFDPRANIFPQAGYRDAGVWRQAYYHDGEFRDIHLMDITSGEWRNEHPES
jgi:RimJ/RimL family protein N-acetyltransferase